MENSDGEKISNDEKVAAICLLVNVFDLHKEEEKLLNKALNDFDCVYGEKIPTWLQCIYMHCLGCSDNDLQIQIIREYAEKHDLKLRDIPL